MDTKEGLDRIDPNFLESVNVPTGNLEVLPEKTAERPPLLLWVPLVANIFFDGPTIVSLHFLQDNHSRRDNIFAI